MSFNTIEEALSDIRAGKMIIVIDDEDYVEDCAVCCRPILLHATRDEDGQPSVSATRESD